MKILNKRLVTLFCSLLLLVQLVNAQEGNKYFRNISVEKGLSQSTVFSIKQDSLGFIWMATQDGLNRYDSKGFKVYRPVDGIRTDCNRTISDACLSIIKG
ncbi:hypothetical protein [Pedobacter sp. HDW13]|uniref:hypothetical protein n=1 Tax=Pedobacter sp. HDW13 TaxID=2714940 RepID=UPI001F100F0B|nr:hypothetical protein [Pedobacter sp. HDW13]